MIEMQTEKHVKKDSRENYDSDQEWSDAWFKWYTGNQIVEMKMEIM